MKYIVEAQEGMLPYYTSYDRKGRKLSDIYGCETFSSLWEAERLCKREGEGSYITEYKSRVKANGDVYATEESVFERYEDLDKRGGAREGAGRKPSGLPPKETWSVKVTEEEKELLKTYLETIREK